MKILASSVALSRLLDSTIHENNFGFVWNILYSLIFGAAPCPAGRDIIRAFHLVMAYLLAAGDRDT